MITLFADIIVPFALPGTFTYRVPVELQPQIAVGMRALVPFGQKRSRLYTGIVRKIHEQAPRLREARFLDSLLDEIPVISEKQFEFWEWMAGYYLCHQGEVMNAALPSGMKLSSESVLMLQEDFSSNLEKISEQEMVLVEALERQGRLTMDEAGKILNSAKTGGHVRRLLDKGIISLEEEVKEVIKLKMAKFISSGVVMHDEVRLEDYMNKLTRAKSSEGRMNALLKYIDLSGHFSESPVPVRKDLLIKESGCTAGNIKKLVEDEIFEEREFEISRFSSIRHAGEPRILSKAQETALMEVKKGFEETLPVLLHGVTSSGKTEIFLHLMKETIESGKEVLYLLPEISLATQITKRIQAIFGNRAAVYHSRFNEGERAEIWRSLIFRDYGAGQSGMGLHNVSIVIGARSAIFLPFNNLGLVIIDEEHDTSYKQQDPNPRYQGRDAALMLAKLNGANAILGSATPSIESYHQARAKRYKLVELNERHGGKKLPEIITEDLKAARERKNMHLSFTPGLLNGIEEALGKQEQVILFQNRRGFAPMMKCDHCHYVPRCRNCDVSLTFHKAAGLLKCHYCGYSAAPYTQCPACMHESMHLLGAGTEKIEEELQILLPGARVARLDFDTTRSKAGFHKIIESFEQRDIDILVGTQMVTKGLDFENVGIVGILSADQLLQFPEFRAAERAFQLMVQVSGRAGRKHRRGKVLIQALNTGSPTLQDVIRHDFKGFYNREIEERRAFQYPPFTRLIRITLKHKIPEVLNKASTIFTKGLKSSLDGHFVGPAVPYVSRVRGMYLLDYLVKTSRDVRMMDQARRSIEDATVIMQSQEGFSGVRVVVDVDPA